MTDRPNDGCEPALADDAPSRLTPLFLALGPLVALVTGWIALEVWQLSTPASVVAAVTAWCAVWWLTEPVPIPVTSLLPMALLPLGGALTPTQVAQSYGSPLILLLMGGFMLSGALAKSGAHRRLALVMIHACAKLGQRGLVLGFMLAAAFLSMWISNTATTLMLLPVALAVLEDKRFVPLTIPLLLGIAYSASLGGTGTPIGTPPNLVYMQVVNDQFGTTTSFPLWMSWGLPVVLIMLPLMFLWLTRRVASGALPAMERPGAWQVAEKRVMIVFVITAALWMTRTAPFGGWQAALDLPYANDAAVAMLAVVALCCIPSGKRDANGNRTAERLLDWETAGRIPWGVLILFAGGITIARGFIETGLSDAVATQLTALATLPPWLMVLSIALGVTFLTEMTSNTATSSLLMPVLAATAIASEVPPELLMVPAAISASCAFMLPVATAPNAVIYGSGRVPIRTMAAEGFVMNLIGAAVITAVVVVRFG
ncbi:SLC13/DASS family transporter [Wenzhouxiangella sp. XN79A]|uniref:SLC13 family permease n=1 Tax=Wenzhouxiangella sp. XN79A TaxID=2724193 RepID=UPI00144A545C|nr:SLC13 family permease [Wenzhouxiangella sp. XN79A]NKI36572.1 SLC13/DASS family transporter [Wenzhouxiangella sp. XN79A]